MSEESYQDSRKGPVMAYSRMSNGKVNGHINGLSEGSNGHLDYKKSNHQHHNGQHKQNGLYINGYSKSLKRSHDHGPSTSSTHGDSSTISKKHHHRSSKHGHHHRHNKKNLHDRFSRTANALKQAGLLELTLQTAQLMQENDQIQKEIDKLQEQTLTFSKTLHAQLEEKLKANSNRATNEYVQNSGDKS